MKWELPALAPTRYGPAVPIHLFPVGRIWLHGMMAL